jgi:hypothetical protein
MTQGHGWDGRAAAELADAARPEPSNGELLPGPEAFRSALEAERSARITAERTAERLAVAVAREHRLRQHAEEGARAALTELELAWASRHSAHEPGRGGRRRWRRLRRMRRAIGR